MPLEKPITAQGGMPTSVYDTDDDTHVNTAEALNDGAGNVKTAAEVKTHVDGTQAIAKGGTGATTAQAAIDALSAVAGAIDEHVLTKDTGTGNAKFKANAGAVSSVFTRTGAVTAAENDYSLDQMDLRTKAFFFDDFIGGNADPFYNTEIWDETLNGVGSDILILTDRLGGVLDMIAGPANARDASLFTNLNQFSVASNSVFEIRAKLGGVANTFNIQLNLHDSGSGENISFRFEKGVNGDKWFARTYDGTGTDSDTGIAADTSWRIFKIVCSAGQIDFYIDSVLKTSITTNITSELLTPMLFIRSKEATTNHLYIDDVKIYCNREA